MAAEVDRISFLPLEIKIEILSRLRINHVVRTSALARSWRHLWTHLPCLNLSSDQDPLGNPRNDPTDTVPSSWIQRVHRLVSSLRGPLRVFQLFFSEPLDDESVLQSLLDLLLQKGGLQTLNLYFFNDPGKIHLPLFHSLKVLRLIGCHVALPIGFRGFLRLETLELYGVKISNDDLNLLLRTSNNLTSLVISNCGALENPLSVNLSLPLLRQLEFENEGFFENLSVVSSPCLEHAVIRLIDADCSSQNFAWMMLRLVTSVAMVSSLKLDFDVLKCLSLVALPFNFAIPRLRFLMFSLDVDTIDNTMATRVYDAFLWLLRSMPILEELEIELDSIEYHDQADRLAILMKELPIERHDSFACLERTVTSVTINMSSFDVTSIAWIQFFLLNAKGLELLKIGYFHGDDMPSFIEELQKVEVTSSDAKVMFFNSHTHQITNVYE
ncbi:F-box/RNI/FBD-like domain protein [Rhynchospora pubera]|uniref:F-box/RNI/FBD-like domain protein n=1 Tax=Rhynchospora pubera TaxID=906938 RepID=A0AAV8GXU5_9POAL|nr:F-box/RNI/FBD-like domain protein [Rhynchospora pubera]